MARISAISGGGFLLEDGAFSLELDPKSPRGDFVTTHAHTDHLPRKISSDSRAIASTETIDFARERYGISLPNGLSLENVSLSDAGHMVGSKMVSIGTSKGKVLYTGDFSTIDRFFLKGAKPEKCNVLIVDSTFALPEFSFPKIEEIIESSRAFLESSKSKRAVFYGYSYGKAQVLTRLAKELGIVPVVQANVYSANKISERHGAEIGNSLLFGTKEADKQVYSGEPSIVIAPLTAKSTIFSKKLESLGFRSAVFTGWAKSRGRFLSGYDSAIPLSDHAGFSEILSFVEKCSPEKVVVAHAKKGSPIVSALQVLGFETNLAEKGFSLEF